jgi:hypothetical protein
MKDQSRFIIESQKEFLEFLKSRFQVIHESNVFFRDLHYGVMGYLAMKNLSSRYSESEEVTRKVVQSFVEGRLLIPIDTQTWMLNYPAFKKASSKPVIPSKPAVSVATPAPAASTPLVATRGASASAAQH